MSNDARAIAGSTSGPSCEPSAPARRLTAARKKAFLAALRKTGSVLRAASIATPWAQGAQRGAQTFRDERIRDPEFAAAWDAALEAVLGSVEEEIVRRAMEVPKRPVWERGEVRGWVEDRAASDRLLLRLAAKLDPTWRERTAVDQNVSVAGAVLTIRPVDVMLLQAPDQTVLLGLLEKIADAKGQRNDVP